MSKPKITLIKMNNTWGRLVTDDPTILEATVRKFSVKVDQYWFMPKYKKGLWDGKIKFVQPDGSFYIGIFSQVYKYVNNEKLYDMEIDPEFIIEEDKEQFKERFLLNLSSLDYPFEPRSYQLRGALKSCYYKRGICEHVTSSGKSFTIALSVHHLLKENPQHKVLILVPRIDLVEQFVEELENYGMPVDIIGKYCGYQKDEDMQVVVSTWQSIYKKSAFLKEFTVLIVDETHGLRAAEVRKVSDNAVNASIRLGFTGTMPDNQADQMLVQGAIGPILDVVDYEQLQKAKQIADIKINIIKCNYNEEICEENEREDYVAEKDRVEKDEKRNKIICRIAKEYLDKGKNALILVKKLEHVKCIQDIIEKTNIKYSIVTGATKIVERNEARHDMEVEGGKLIIATTGVYSTGISIKRLHCVIFASPGKSKIQTLQSVGRGLRLHNTKTHLHLYDVCENLKFSKKHFTQRLKYYDKAKFEYTIKEITI
jgi:superfamily II DNA or RNA helicase